MALRDLKTITGRVAGWQTIDQFGAIRKSNVRVFHTLEINPITGWIDGHVSNATTQQSISYAGVMVGATPLKAGQTGYYLGELDSGLYSSQITADGYIAKTVSGIDIIEGGFITRDHALYLAGDINGDGFVDLADALVGLKVLTGDTSITEVFREADVNLNQKIGVEEVIFVLQEVAK